jgi:WS/DGAT/MGAT family acyltransferase
MSRPEHRITDHGHKDIGAGGAEHADMTRLTSLDGSFLRLETPNAHMHVAWSGLFEPPAGTLPTPTVEALRAKVATRLARVPRFRQRLAFPPLRLAEPSWVDDDRFDVARHVTVPAEGGGPLSAERFRLLSDEMLSEPLDRARPLWHIYLVPRLDDSRLGLIFKMHHALVDGKSAVELALLLFDLSPDAEPEPMDDWRPAPPPNAARLALDAFASNAGEPLRAARGITRMAGRPGEGGLAGTLKRAALAFEQDLLRPAPTSYLNGEIGPQRVLVRHRARMEDIVRAKQKAGVTVNDVCLAAVSGALRELALLRREQPQPLKAMVPVSVRADDQRQDLGNRISFAFIELPVEVRSRAGRLERVHEATAAFKASGRPTGTGAVLGALGLLPDPLKDRAARLASSARVFNLTVSNIPGPRFPLYMLGAKLSEAYPVVPLAEQHSLSIGMFSYMEDLFFGLYADPAVLPEVEQLPEFLNAEVVALAGPKRRRRRGAVEAPSSARLRAQR